jgi:hypothetical protein
MAAAGALPAASTNFSENSHGNNRHGRKRADRDCLHGDGAMIPVAHSIA